MATKNDERIIELKSQIELKKKELASNKVRFSPETNCILTLYNTTYNLNVLDKDSLCMLLIELNSYVLSANDLGIDIPNICGYPISIWISDIKSKIKTLDIKNDEAALKKMEAKLDKLLSDDKKTEMELDEIAALLK